MSKPLDETAETEISEIGEEEVLARIRAIDEGREEGFSFEDVMRDAEDILTEPRSDFSATLP